MALLLVHPCILTEDDYFIRVCQICVPRLYFLCTCVYSLRMSISSVFAPFFYLCLNFPLSKNHPFLYLFSSVKKHAYGAVSHIRENRIHEVQTLRKAKPTSSWQPQQGEHQEPDASLRKVLKVEGRREQYGSDNRCEQRGRPPKKGGGEPRRKGNGSKRTR